MAVHNKVGQNYCDWKDQRYRPGDVAIGGQNHFLLPHNWVLTMDIIFSVLPLYRESFYESWRKWSMAEIRTLADIYGLVINVCLALLELYSSKLTGIF